MKYLVEQNLTEFEFWCGAKTTASLLTTKEIEKIEENIEECFYPDVPTDTQINDTFWFEDDWIADILGFPTIDVIHYRGTKRHWFSPYGNEFYTDEDVQKLFEEDSYGCDTIEEFIETEGLIDIDEEYC